MPKVAVADVAGGAVVGENLERGAAASATGLEVASGHLFGGRPVGTLGYVGTRGSGGDVGVDPNGGHQKPGKGVRPLRDGLILAANPAAAARSLTPLIAA